MELDRLKLKAAERDFLRCLSTGDRTFLVRALTELLLGQQRSGFEALVDILQLVKKYDQSERKFD